MKLFQIALLIALTTLSACTIPANSPIYPVTEQIEQIDTYHGVDVSDPYQWLEEDVRQSDRVRQWVQAQNEVTFDYLKSLPQRAVLRQRLETLWNYDKPGTPWKLGNTYFVRQRKGLQNHAVIYKMDSPTGQRSVLFNPNTWSDDGTTALGSMSFSPDGTYAGYGIQKAGSDWRTWKIRNIETGKDLPEVFPFLKMTRFAWTPDNRGFYYSKYPEPDAQAQFTAPNKNAKVMYHRLGTDPADDTVVYFRPDKPDWTYGSGVTDDGRYLIITVYLGTDAKNRAMYFDLQKRSAKPVDLIDNFEHEYSFVDNDGPVFYFITDNAAPRRRLIAIDIRQPAPQHWREIIPQTEAPLMDVSRIDNHFICSYLEDVTSRIRLFSLKGEPIETNAFPKMGTLSGFSGKNSDTETFYSYQSFTTPPQIYRYDLRSGKSTLLEKTQIDYDADRYVSKQVFYTSKDGTRVPMFIMHKKGLVLDGKNPTLLYGYGGFNSTLKPYFSSTRGLWLETGGVFAMANLRGGGEYGQTWHEAGKRMKKQNVFDDFIAAAEYLIDQRYTSSKKLAIQGGSNGGLLVGACMAQRPDLFAAAIPEVGIMDMLRYDQFTAGRFWVGEYGSAQENKEMFEYLKGYSPYHNLKDNTRYPATLVVTADTDDRVVPGHSFKFTARLQQAHKGSRPVLIRIETSAGHGSGKPTSMAIEETADIYAFLMQNLGVKSVPPSDK